MSKSSGFALLLAGLGTAGYVVVFDAPVQTSAYLADIPSPVATPAPRIAVMQSVPEVKERRVPKPSAVPAPDAGPEPKAPIVITLPRRPTEATTVAVAKSATPPRDTATVTRELQRELKRVGCYEGELNGTWTVGSRAAMKAFTDRVNAKLPVDVPDTILLSLVQTHQGRACGTPCPAGEGLAEDGRCIPAAILAHAAVKKGAANPAATMPVAPALVRAPAPAITGWSTTTSAAPPAASTLPEGRMALAGPTADPRIAVAPVPAEKFRGPGRDANERRPRQYVERGPSRGVDAKSLFQRFDLAR